MRWWWEFFKSLFKVEEFVVDGDITLGPGDHEIDVSTTFPDPKRIWLSVDEPEEVPTCVGNLNWVAAKLGHRGFVLYAQIKSNACKIRYKAFYDTAPDDEDMDHNKVK